MRQNAPTVSGPSGVTTDTVSADLGAMEHHVRLVGGHTRAPRFMAALKGNTYRKGLLKSALSAGAGSLGTAPFAGDLALRRHGIASPILAWLHLALDSGLSRFGARRGKIFNSSAPALQLAYPHGR